MILSSCCRKSALTKLFGRQSLWFLFWRMFTGSKQLVFCICMWPKNETLLTSLLLNFVIIIIIIIIIIYINLYLNIWRGILVHRSNSA